MVYQSSNGERHEEMKKHVFIINPKAGKGKGLELIGRIRENFKTPIILRTCYPGHATELASEYAQPDTIIYSIGGDGTLNEVINGVASSEHALETAVAVVPYGSGNDFLKELTDIKDPVKLLERYRAQKEKSIDLGMINGRYFIGVASVGFDATVTYNARKYKRLPLIGGELSYLISVFMTIIRLKSYVVLLGIDGNQPIRKRMLFTTMANGCHYGGGMKPAPNALIDDGMLDFCVVDKAPRWKVLLLLPKYIRGKHASFKEVNMYRGKSIVIKGTYPLPINIDGEVIWSKKIDVQVKETAIKILIP